MRRLCGDYAAIVATAAIAAIVRRSCGIMRQLRECGDCGNHAAIAAIAALSIQVHWFETSTARHTYAWSPTVVDVQFDC